MTEDSYLLWLSRHLFTPTELEGYLSCPFRFYAQSYKGLRPPPETEPDLTPVEIGSCLHKILEQLTGKEDLLLVADRVLDSFRAERPGLSAPLFDRRRERIRRTLSEFLRMEKEWQESSGLHPEFLEWSFGTREVPPLQISEEGQPILIRGRIDRIDVDRKRKRFLVIDYKTGSRKVLGSAIVRGESLQLPLYVKAVQEILLPGFEPMGGLYYRLADLERKDGFLHSERLPEGIDIHPRSSTLIPPLRWNSLFEATFDSVLRIVKAIRSAQFDPTPDFCEPFCPYRDICRLEEPPCMP